MRKKAPDEELAKPFCVRWGHEDNYDFFEKSKDAFDFVDKHKQRSPVWIIEIGVYTTDQGNLIRDWIYFWWNQKTDWGETPRHQSKYAKLGYPENAQSRLVDYQPVCVDDA